MKADVVFTLEQAGWPALLVDTASVICRANPAALRLFGPALESASPHLSSIWSTENPTSPERFLAQWQQSPAPTVSLKFRARDGQTLGHFVSVCAFNQETQPYFILQLLPERSAPKSESASPGFETSLVQKQKLDCALQMARSVALDFNNALTSILGHASLVLGRMEPNHPWRASLLEVERAAARAAEIANDLGAFSRQEKESRAQGVGNLNLVLQRTVDGFRKSPCAEGIEWGLELEPKLFTAKFDEAKLQQALAKILANAREALPKGGRISVRSRNVELAERAQDRNVQLVPGAYVSIEIVDSGSGIAPDILPRVFEPFFTTKGGNHRGLGLAWVYGVVTNHGGGVAISSQPGEGTSVRLYLPADSRTVWGNGPGAEDLRGKETVLLVDDEDLVLTLGREILSAYGYRVLTVGSGERALEILAGNEKIDLVITDLVMPVMSGRELVEQMQLATPGIPVLCTSGYVWPANQEHEGAYLQKPFTAHDLLLKVRQVLAPT